MSGWWVIDRLRAWGGEQPDRDLRVGRDDRKFLNDVADEIEALRAERAAMAVEWERMKDPNDRSSTPFQRLNRMFSGATHSGSSPDQNDRSNP